jgi:hypothetical protein
MSVECVRWAWVEVGVRKDEAIIIGSVPATDSHSMPAARQEAATGPLHQQESHSQAPVTASLL